MTLSQALQQARDKIAAACVITAQNDAWPDDDHFICHAVPEPWCDLVRNFMADCLEGHMYSQLYSWAHNHLDTVAIKFDDPAVGKVTMDVRLSWLDAAIKATANGSETLPPLPSRAQVVAMWDKRK